jgi:hypothetical protein
MLIVSNGESQKEIKQAQSCQSGDGGGGVHSDFAR